MTYNIDITELWNHNFNSINSPDGFQPISNVIKKPNKKCYAVLFSNGNIVECSEDHLFQDANNNWIKTKDLVINTIIKTKYNNTVVIDKRYIGTHNTYDLTVDHPEHRYYSDNIVSHNTGKTSTATALIKEIGGEALFINASLDKGIEVLRSQISNFASTESFDNKLKIVVLDESDNFSPDAQKAFRGVIEAFSNNCRFILTGNYKEKMLGPLLDRLENYDFNNFNKKEMVKPIFEHIKAILENEKIKYNPKDLVPIINTYYPSIRSMIGALQKFSTSGTLEIHQDELDNQSEYSVILDAVKTKNFNNMINLVNDLASPDNMFTYMYKSLSEFKNMPQVVMIIAKYQFQSSSVRDKNLNLAACLAELITTQ